MGVFDKIKNALFEEEYIEVEEKPIAKKVVIPEKKEPIVPEREEKPMDEDFDTEPLLNNSSEDHFKFPMVDDNDFEEESYSEPKVEEKPINRNEFKREEYRKEVVEEPRYDNYKDEDLYNHKNSKSLYGIDENSKINVHEYGMYEKEKKIFRPSPIISPIYGILDKNYKKEEIVTKKEVRLTSSYARENLSVDDVRNKAYGSLNDDIARGDIEVEEAKHAPVEDEQDDILVDLSSTIDKPEVSEITMGDAEEYFQDLGLEYNIDYKDASKEKAAGRRSQKNEVVDETKEETPVVGKKEEKAPEIDDNDNLFDLIDSMYEDENKE